MSSIDTNTGEMLAAPPNESYQKIQQQLAQLLMRWRRQFLQQQLFLFSPKLMALGAMVVFMAFSLASLGLSADILTIEDTVWLFLLMMIFGLFAKIALVLRSKAYRRIEENNLIAHFNNRFAQLEYSAQLLLRDENQLSALEQLQYRKVRASFDDILQQQAQVNYSQLSPIFAKRQWLIRSVSLLLLLLILSLTHHFKLLDKTLTWFQSQQVTNQLVESTVRIKPKAAVIDILSQQVTITPPDYSLVKNQASGVNSDLLDIEALVGSYAQWTFSFSHKAANYFIVFSNGERYPLIKQDNASFTFRTQLMTSMVYHLAIADDNAPVSEKFSTIHRITLTPDQAPKIRFITPKNTVTQFAKNSTPNLVAEVQISDDFALTEVKILASIAKGSGEGVKFRDQNFTFDRSEMVEGKAHYYKNWSLADLAMEPGDELYFTILASDNRQPINQQTRSATKIIRWLEDEQAGINADGILIDFMPEYFKSQRQIIIETIELIEDKAELEQSKFFASSELLGVAQSALKEKYGQYLGDETEGLQSVGVSFDDDHHAEEDHAGDGHGDNEAQRPTIQVHDEHGGSNAVITPPGHAHESEAANNASSKDLSGRMSLIDRYGHNHEDSDVGVMTSQDPKALMKQSLANMWQAELHLMLAEPELALPFEQQALKLLKQAKKAERIYVKRLGFEPPPVTEQRRYQGEQSDIIADSVQISRFDTEQLSDQTQLAFSELLPLLHQFIQTSEQNIASAIVSEQLSTDELALVEVTKQGIIELLPKRPAMVEVLAIIEQILLERQLKLSQCQQCINLLAGKIEQLIPHANALPSRKAQDFFDQQPVVLQYSQFLEDNL